MKTAELEVIKKTKQTIRLVEGEFTPSEASFLVHTLLDEKINFHKLNRLSILEGNCKTKTTYDTGRITELENEKKVAQEFFARIKQQGLKLQIKGKLEITVADTFQE